MAVALWDEKTTNLIDDFDEEAEALAYVCETVALHGHDAVATWALDRLDRRQPMIRGDELLKLVMAIPA
jgi:hypothetical protein